MDSPPSGQQLPQIIDINTSAAIKVGSTIVRAPYGKQSKQIHRPHCSVAVKIADNAWGPGGCCHWAAPDAATIKTPLPIGGHSFDGVRGLASWGFEFDGA
jgi:hypothetical protein